MATIDPSTWPAQISEIESRLIAQLSSLGAQIDTGHFLGELTEVRGLGRAGHADSTNRHLVGEVEHLLREALRRLEGEALIMGLGRGGGRDQWSHIRAMAEDLGWPNPDRMDTPGYDGRYAGTVKLWSMQAAGWVLQPATRWPNVDRLREQAAEAHRRELDVASAVVARVAVEEAIRLALEDLGDPQPEMRAAPRESRLFDNHLTRNTGFDLLDRSATHTALSSIRAAGNTAVHEGAVDSAIVMELNLTLLPQALASLSRAVDEKAGPASP